MAALDAAQIRALVTAHWRPEEPRQVFAVHADPVWDGPASIEGPHGLIQVAALASPLGVREALVAHEPAGGVLVVLTPCPGPELGPDVLARLVSRQVLRVDPFGSLRALFGATELDPAVTTNPWLIDELIALAPRGGWLRRKPLNGVLDADLAWEAWQEGRLGLDQPPSDLADLVLAGRRPQVAAGLAGLPPEQLLELARRWGGGKAEPAGVIVSLIAAGRGPELAALGIVAGVLWAPAPDAGTAAVQVVARARLERVFGRDRLDEEAARAWEGAAIDALAHEALPVAVLDAAQGILEREGPGLLALSDRLPEGFESRTNSFGRALTQGDLAAAEAALAQMERHRLSRERPQRLDTARHALRLLRRQSLPTRPAPTTFAEAAAQYADEGSWLDAATRAVSGGDDAPDLAAALGVLTAQASVEAQAMRSGFGALLSSWSRAEPLTDGRILPVERILDEVVAPIAVADPVLLLVCDGMPLLVAHALVRALFAEGWAPMAPAERQAWPVGVGVLPTVTEVCRTSLLTGRRMRGGQDEERVGFADHRGLRAASSPTKPPVLFHKSSLVSAGGTALPAGVHDAIADRSQRVVGVVVNAVDDHLTRGDQVRVEWDASSMKPLRWVLDAAEEAGRLVVLTADHGHVLREPGAQRRAGSNPGGERWRVAPPGAGAGEIAVAGPRVLLGEHSVILPTDDRISYGVPKHGYHGGATPAEVLVPIEVLGRHLPGGWAHRALLAPAWWDPAGGPAGPAPALPAKRPRRSRPAQDPLFEAAAPVSPAQSSWVRRLLDSTAFQAQRGRAHLPRPMPDERVARYLTVIDANGGAIPLATMALRVGEPPDALRLALALVRRLLNVDGAQVLAVGLDATVVLDREALAQQFEISIP